MKLPRALATALRLSRPERRVALASLVALGVVVRALRRDGLAGAERRLGDLPRLLPHNVTVPAARLAVLVRAVAGHVPGALCLAQSLVLARLLDEAGARDVVLRIGVRPGVEVLAAHAWVEVAGVVQNDEPDVAARFAVIDTRAVA